MYENIALSEGMKLLEYRKIIALSEACMKYVGYSDTGTITIETIE